MKAITIFSIIIVIGIFAAIEQTCSDSKNEDAYDKFEALIKEGKLSEAREALGDVHKKLFEQGAKRLINEYLAIGNLDQAIDVYENVSSNHLSTYDMKFRNGEYERYVTAKLYKALIEADRFEDAWQYHPLEYEDQNYPGNGGCYYGYMTDVIAYLCQHNRQAEAQRFFDKNIIWFKKNVDNNKWGNEYPQYSYSNMRSQLQAQVNGADIDSESDFAQMLNDQWTSSEQE